MDPVQRVPRYTLLFRTMIKHMAAGDPQRAKLLEADEIAGKIAQAETDEQTKRAAIMYCLSATVDGFPPDLISNSRRFIDCIDVEDIPLDGLPSASSNSSSSLAPLHCTLFLFDDKLVIVKRPGSGEKSGRALAGLDEMEKSTKAGGLPLGMKKSGMSCKGVVEVTDLVAADVSGPGGLPFAIWLWLLIFWACRHSRLL
jgi:protein ECT2